MLSFDGKELRNLQEQVWKNMDDIDTIIEKNNLANLGINVIQVEPISSPDLLPTNYQGNFGDAYLVGTETPYDLYVWTRGNEWFDFGPLNAPSVVPGPIGPQGIQGEQGIRGSFWYSQSGAPTNVEGVNMYDQALDGSTGDVYQFVNGWQLTGNIRGPQGIQGIQGIVGPTGPIGPTGPVGPKGDQGQFIQIVGSLANTAQLPTPSSVPRYSAYLIPIVGTEHVFLIIGEEPNLSWHDAGGFGGGTAVTINGVPQSQVDLGNDIVAPSYDLSTNSTAEVNNDGVKFLNLNITGNNPTGSPATTQQGDISLPIVASDTIEPTVTEDKLAFEITQAFIDQIEQDIADAKPPEVQLNVPSTSTSGQLTEEQLSTLQENKGAYIMFNNEVYRLQDTQHISGYLIYTHIGYDNANSVFMIKCITITINTRGWVLATREVMNPSNYSTTAQMNTAISNATQGFLPLTGGELSGTLKVDSPIFANRWAEAPYQPAIIFDKMGTHFSGIGASNEQDTIQLGPVSSANNETYLKWVTGYQQIWNFIGTIKENGIAIPRPFITYENSNLNNIKDTSIGSVRATCTNIPISKDGYLISIKWDNTSDYCSQIYLTESNRLFTRVNLTSEGNSWSEWNEVGAGASFSYSNGVLTITD